MNGLLAALFTSSSYLLVVVLTTPSFSPRTAVSIAIGTNWLVLLGITSGVGVQAYLVTYAGATCGLKRRGPISGATGLASGFSSLVSMFSLVAVGCCGTWLYVLSFLPGLIGTGATALLIGHSSELVPVGFVAMAASIFYTYWQILAASKRNASGSGSR